MYNSNNAIAKFLGSVVDYFLWGHSLQEIIEYAIKGIPYKDEDGISMKVMVTTEVDYEKIEEIIEASGKFKYHGGFYIHDKYGTVDEMKALQLINEEKV